MQVGTARLLGGCCLRCVEVYVWKGVHTHPKKNNPLTETPPLTQQTNQPTTTPFPQVEMLQYENQRADRFMTWNLATERFSIVSGSLC